MKAIYETRGRAREFCELACNLYRGCGHRCIYCYGASVIREDPEKFKNEPKPRNGILRQLNKDAIELKEKGDKRTVLLCFVTDPYQPIDEEHMLTRSAINILHSHGLRVTILTKAGLRATRDFDLLRQRDAFAVSLTLVGAGDSLYWEPGASMPWERVETLRMAHDLGIETWASCEPIISVVDTLALINETKEFVGHYKIGTLNYHPHAKTMDWKKTAESIVKFMDERKLRYYMKKDLAKHIGHPEGFWVGF